MKKSLLISKLLKDSTWSMISTFANKISFVIVGILVARFLGAENFAIFAIIQSVVIMLANVFSQSITTATSKHIAEYINESLYKVSAGAAITFLFSLSFAVLIFFISSMFPSYFSQYLLFHSNYIKYVDDTTYIIMLTIGLGWAQGVFAGFRAFKLNAFINILYASFSVILAFVLTSLYGIDGAFKSIIATQCIIFILSLLCIKKLFRKKNIAISFRGAWGEKSAITLVGLPVFLTGIIVAPITWYSNKLLSVLSDGLVQLAIFSASMQWSSLFTQVSVVLGTVLIPILASNKDNKNNSLEKVNFYSSWLFTVVFTIPLIIFVDFFIKIYGKVQLIDDFKISVSFVLFSAILTSFKSGIARKIIVLNLSWFSVLSNLGWAFMFIILSLYARSYGAVGITGALFFSQLLHFLITTPYFLKRKIVDKSLFFNRYVIMLSIIPFLSLYFSFCVDNKWVKIASCISLVLFALFESFVLLKSKKVGIYEEK
ncbi:TPA: oligosaccharide flippase family protein [Raoultella ornithinolytica]